MYTQSYLKSLSQSKLISLCYDHGQSLYDRLSNETTIPQLTSLILEKQASHTPDTELQIWSLPPLLNPNFTGREHYLRQIRERLVSGNQTALTQAIHGLGGIGKSQVALKYAEMYRDTYQYGFWLNAEKPSTLKIDYANIANHLFLPGREKAKQDSIIQDVRRWLSQTSGWLLIFDNAESVSQIRPYLPSPLNGHIIITSRNPNWRRLGIDPLALQVFKRTESVEFLRKRTGSIRVGTASLIEELGDFPLALEQAAAYLEETGVSFTQYLDLFKIKRHLLFKDARPPDDYPDTLATTWELSFLKLQEQRPVAISILNLCAFLAPDDIPLSILSEPSEALVGELGQSGEYLYHLNQTIAALQKYSLVKRTGDYLSLHRMVQAVTHDRLSGAERQDWKQVSIILLNDAFPSDNIRNPQYRSRCAELLPHAVVALASYTIHSEQSASLMYKIGSYLLARSDYNQSIDFLQRSLAMREQLLPLDHPDIARSLMLLGALLRRTNDYDQATLCLQRALTIQEKVLDANHPDISWTLNTFGALLRYQRKFKQAEVYLKRALAIEKANHGQKSGNILIVLNTIGALYRSWGKYEQARHYLEWALSIQETPDGVGLLDRGTIILTLGALLRKQKKFKEALTHLKQVLAIREEYFGANSYEVVPVLNLIGATYRDMGDYQTAITNYKRSLNNCEKYFGNGHQESVSQLKTLALLYNLIGEYPQANAYLEQVLSIQEKNSKN